MPVELQIIRASEFVRMGGEGQFDLAASRAVLVNLVDACRRRGVQRALLDARRARAELTPAELASLVDVFHELGFTKNQRLAILHSGDPYHRARLFASISRMKGWSVRAFGNFEEALGWLSVCRDRPRPRLSAASKQVHVAHEDDDTKVVAIKPRTDRKTEHAETPPASAAEHASRNNSHGVAKRRAAFGKSSRSRKPECRAAHR